MHYLEKDLPDAWVDAAKVSAYDPGDVTGGPPLGTYQCWMPMYGNSYMGSFVLKPGGVYQFLTGPKTSGRYRYTPAIRAVAFAGGALDGKVIETEYINQKPNSPMIRLVFPKGRRADDIQNCLYRP